LRLRVPAVAALILVLAAGALAVYDSVTPTEPLRQEAVVVDIPAHEGTLDVARRLEEAGVVRSRWTFLAVAAGRGRIRSLKAGEYEFPQGATPLTVVRYVGSGRVRQYAVLHPEGASVAELARALETARLAKADDVLRLARDRAFLATQNLGDAPSLEGYVFPDTYYFVKGMRAEEILARMVQRMRAKLGADIETRARARGLTVHQLLTLASIVEREAIAPEEAKIIAGVFWNRLKISMPLQADPTVQYAVGKERRTLTRTDLGTEHPYNTYRNVGLPPGPIASPGLRAVEAALDPAPVKYLYFVKLDERRHHFSATMEEHNQAVARYRASRANSR
jgi:UPF0755 protein